MDEEYAEDVAEVMGLNRESFFNQDIITRLEQAITTLQYHEHDPLVWRDDGVGIHVSDCIHDAIVWIKRKRSSTG